MQNNYSFKSVFSLAFVIILLLSSAIVQAQTIRYVKQGGAGNGTSWANASGNLQAMITASATNDEVWIAAGTYKPTVAAGVPIYSNYPVYDMDKSFLITSDIKLYGGFPATGNPGMTDRNSQINETILSGDLGIPNITTDNACHVLVILGTENNYLTPQTIIDGLTITKGYASGYPGLITNGSQISKYYGGGIYITYGDITLKNTVIRENTSADDGGGIYLQTASIIMENTTITNNTSVNNGGGIYITNSTAIINNSYIENNSGKFGGGIGTYYSDLTIHNISAAGNISTWNGGGIYIDQTSFEISNSAITGNTASSYGSGIHISSSPIATLTNVTVSGNAGNEYGAAVYASSPLSLRNSVIYGNQSGLFVYYGTENVTMVNNVIQNYDNTENGNSNANPYFINAPSYTEAPFTGGDYNTSISCSPLINTGNNTYLPTSIINDLAGSPRTYDQIVDIGAFEYQGMFFNAPPSTQNQTFDYGATVGNLTATGENIKWYANATGGETLSVDILLEQGTYYVSQTIGLCESVRIPANITILTYPVRYVKAGATGTGKTWADAAGNIQDMINAPLVEEVWVAAGTYMPENIIEGGITNRDKTFILKPGVKVYGGFPVQGNPGMANRNWEINETILSGDLGIIGDASDNAYHVILIPGVVSPPVMEPVTLDGFTIKDGNANATYESGDYSNMFNGQYLTKLNGGGIYLPYNSSAILNNLIVTQNYSGDNGGGLFTDYGSEIIITSSDFSYNTAFHGGGGIYNDGNMVITDTNFNNNEATDGGGIYNSENITITNSKINNNNSGSYGGGVFTEGFNCIMTKVTISGNTAAYGAGGIRSDFSNLTLTNVLISGNQAAVSGGGIYSFSNNNFTNVTITGNNITAGAAGVSFSGGMFIHGGNSTFKNSIVSGNRGGISNPFSHTVAYNNCIIEGLTSTENGNISGNLNPVFEYAPHYETAPFTDGDYNLRNSSPLINMGSNELYTAAEGTNLQTDTDVNNNNRVYNLANGGTIDIGALEYQGEPGCLYATTWNGTAWSNGIPDSFDYVAIINGNYTSDNGIITACSLMVASGTVTVKSGHTFNIKGNINVNNPTSSLIVENNGAILQQDDAQNTGNIIFNRLANPLYYNQSTLWSSPVSGQNLQGFSPLTLNDRFLEYVATAQGENQAGYYPVTEPENNMFTAGKGYLISMPDTFENNPENWENYINGLYSFGYNGKFTGVPHNGNINTFLNYSGNMYTAIGNPYPSPVGIAEIFEAGQNVFDPLSGIYLWNQGNNASGYATVTTTSYISNSPDATNGFTGNPAGWSIAPAQGFLVQGNGNSTFTFTNSMRKPAVNGQPFFRNNNTPSRLWLNLKSAQGVFSQMSVAYMQNATIGLDYGMEAKTFGLSPNRLYSIVNETELAIQTRPEFNISDIVPLGFAVSQPGEYTIELDHFDGVFTGGYDIYIKDIEQGGLLHSLKSGSYTFIGLAGTFNSRFEIIYVSPLDIDDIVNNNNIVVYKKDGILYINAGNIILNNVTLYDISGRNIYTLENINSKAVTIDNLNAKDQVIILKINSDKGLVTKKILF